MKLIRQILEGKPADIWLISPNKSVYEAIEVMSSKDIGALLVVEDEKLCGLISERDYTRKVILKERSSKNTLVKNIMTEKVYTAKPEDSIQECMALMTDQHFRHLPILDKDSKKILGMVSMGDLVKSIIEEQEFVINQLESYISS